MIISAQLFEARLHDHSTRVRQCYKCNQWGHTQSACGKQARCGICAGSHNTRECPKERVSCVNCGKPHRAWQRGVCNTFKAFLSTIQGRRAELYARSASIRSAGGPQTQRSLDGFQLVQGPKRGRSPGSTTTQQPQAKRGPGRPPGIYQAGLDPSQTRITGETHGNSIRGTSTPRDEVHIPAT